ncbi:hypothetical protein D3C80_1397160 [compost metagenome]
MHIHRPPVQQRDMPRWHGKVKKASDHVFTDQTLLGVVISLVIRLPTIPDHAYHLIAGHSRVSLDPYGRCRQRVRQVALFGLKDCGGLEPTQCAQDSNQLARRKRRAASKLAQLIRDLGIPLGYVLQPLVGNSE